MLFPIWPSTALRTATAGFIAACALAVWLTVSARSGTVAAFAASTLTVIGLAGYAGRTVRCAPVALCADALGITVYFRAGSPLRFERAARVTNWGDGLLAVSLVTATERIQPLVLAADSLPPDAFRELVIRLRRLT